MRHSQIVSLILLVAWLPGCARYQVMADPATALAPSSKTAKSVRVTTNSGDRFLLESATIQDDSIMGVTLNGTPKGVALVDVDRIEVGKTQWTGTLLTIGGVLIATAAIVRVVLVRGWELDGEWE